MKIHLIHKDDRGSIHSLHEEGGKTDEFVILKTKEKYARGGCIHYHSCEHLTVLEGIIEYFYRYDDLIVRSKVLHPGESMTIAPHVAHYYISLTDSNVMEWGPKLEEKQTKDDRFRKIVEEINSRAANVVSGA